MKVIFLDIDGVLNSNDWYVKTRGIGGYNGGDVDPKCIDAEKSEKEPWRTGDITGINKDCPLALHIKPNTRTLKDGTTYCFMDKALGIELGLWK